MIASSGEPRNEPVLAHTPGSAERQALDAELARQRQTPLELPLGLGDARVVTAEMRAISAPHEHALSLGRVACAEPEDVGRALACARAAKPAWAALPLSERAGVFLRAADLAAGPWRARLLAATMLNQSKTVHQAEIDTICELCDFLRFNAAFARELERAPLISSQHEQNRWDLRPLDGFVLAITPFNFTAIAGNLPSAPALLGNTVLWKPSPLAALSAHHVYELFLAAGLPPGVINLVQGDAARISEQALSAADFAGLHFTGSSAVFQQLWARVGSRIGSYRSFPRLVGETGGKNFIVAHASADVLALATAIVRGGFEYQGQKCSAASRVYLPESLAPAVIEAVRSMLAEIHVGDPCDPRNFLGAVIGRAAFTRIAGYIARARLDSRCTILSGGGADDQRGFFVEPTLIEVSEPRHPLMTEEIFGPVVAVYRYADDRFDALLSECDEATPYALTGALFAQDRAVIEQGMRRLRMSAGNFYVNDKPTGAVVGQQPFGGSRGSGSNDKAGSAYNLMRWLSPRVIKENLQPPRDFRYPFLAPG